MQCWFFLEDAENEAKRSAYKETTEKPGESESSVSEEKIVLKEWYFRVKVPPLLPKERVYVTGDCKELGKWTPELAQPLELVNDLWSGMFMVPDGCDVSYRYATQVFVPSTTDEKPKVVIRHWEGALKPRQIFPGQTSSPEDVPDEYGNIYGNKRIERGWANDDTIIQFKVMPNMLTLWSTKFNGRTIHLKISPVNLVRYRSTPYATMAEALEESYSSDAQDLLEAPSFSHVEVARLVQDNPVFKTQEQFGIEYRAHEVIVYQVSVIDIANTAFLVDLYVYGLKAVADDPPYHAGFGYLLPGALLYSEGSSMLPLTSVKHKPLGQLEVEYLIVKPMPEKCCDYGVSYARHWNSSRIGLDVGHRGLGTSFKGEMQNCAEVRENTIASLKTAAIHGADFVEFDVQLSKDQIPVIYHDFHVCIAMKRKKELNESDMLELPVKELTLEQLHFLKVYHISEAKMKSQRYYDEHLEEHQPFPTLEKVLKEIDEKVGFNVEIKCNTRLNDGSDEVDRSFDMNLYLDKILEVVLKHGGQRRIIFSSFNPDICTMIRIKQNKYPVMFLTQGQTLRYKKYKDPRCLTIQAAIDFAVSMNMLGINIHTEDILRDPEQVKVALETGLVVFCWGEDNNNTDTIKYLKNLGIHAVIFDKINEYKVPKESIYLLEARESQKQLLREMANAPSTSPEKEAITEEEKAKRIFDVEAARSKIEAASTATSLSSFRSEVDITKNETSDTQVKQQSGVFPSSTRSDAKQNMSGQGESLRNLSKVANSSSKQSN